MALFVFIFCLHFWMVFLLSFFFFAVTFIFAPLYMFSLLWLPPRFSLSFVYINLNTVYLGVFCLYFGEPGIYPASCSLSFLDPVVWCPTLILENSVFPQILQYFFSSRILIMYILKWVILPPSSGIFIFFFNLCVCAFRLGNFYWHLKVHWFFPWLFKSTDEPESFLHPFTV